MCIRDRAGPPGEASDLGSAAGTERPGDNLPTHHPLRGGSPEPLRSSAHHGRGQDGSEWKPLDLVRSHVGEYALELVAGPQIEREIKQSHPELETQRTGQRLYLYASSTEVLAPLVAQYSEQQSRLRPASVEDVFLKLTGREIRE